MIFDYSELGINGGEDLETKQVRKLALDINVRETENGFKITFNTHTGTLAGKKAEYVARSLDEFLTAASLEALKKLPVGNRKFFIRSTGR